MAALAGMAMFAFTGPAHAEFKSTTDDSIAASPKLRERINEYERNHSPAAAPAEAVKMACPKCQDQVTQQVDYSARGANKPTITVTTHLCDGCGTHWKMTGHGKVKQSVASQTCSYSSAESAACCKTASK